MSLVCHQDRLVSGRGNQRVYEVIRGERGVKIDAASKRAQNTSVGLEGSAGIDKPRASDAHSLRTAGQKHHTN